MYFFSYLNRKYQKYSRKAHLLNIFTGQENMHQIIMKTMRKELIITNSIKKLNCARAFAEFKKHTDKVNSSESSNDSYSKS